MHLDQGFMNLLQNQFYVRAKIESMKKRVVIVGGGINGLTAANYLQKQNFDVKILEKNNNIGGACVKDSVIINKKPVNYPKVQQFWDDAKVYFRGN